MIIKKENTSEFLGGDDIKLPTECSALRIDIGLAGEVPNAAKWLIETNDRFVVGVEPIDHHWDMLTNFSTAETDRPYPEFPLYN